MESRIRGRKVGFAFIVMVIAKTEDVVAFYPLLVGPEEATEARCKWQHCQCSQ